MNVLEARLGVEVAEVVTGRAGGKRLVIPPDLDELATCSLERMFEREVVVLLVLHFGGETIYVPHNGPPVRAELDQVVAMTRDGMSAGDIARELQCSDRTVHNHRAKARERGLLK